MAEGASGGRQIARLAKGASDRTARHADVMNEIIDAINALRNITVAFPVPETGATNSGKFIFADANTALNLTIAPGFPNPADTEKTYVWFAEFVAGAWVFAWRETIECDCGPAAIDGGTA
jgi:hypothetical protein